MSALQLDPDAIIWPKNQISTQAKVFSLLVRFYPKVSQDTGKNGLLLHHSKLLSNAVSRSSRKGHVGIGMASLGILGKEPLWLEFLRVWEVSGVSVQCIRNDDCFCAFCDSVTGHFTVFTKTPGKQRDRWENAKSLLNDTIQIFKLLQVFQSDWTMGLSEHII